jgi:hypothetical protein
MGLIETALLTWLHATAPLPSFIVEPPQAIDDP